MAQLAVVPAWPPPQHHRHMDRKSTSRTLEGRNCTPIKPETVEDNMIICGPIKTWPGAKPKEDATLFPRSKHGRGPSQRRMPRFSQDQNMAARQAKGGRHAFPNIKTWPCAKPKEDATLFPRSKHGRTPSQRRTPSFSREQNMAALQAKGGRHAFPKIKTWPRAKPKEDATL